MFITWGWPMKLCTCVLLDLCSKVLVSGNHNYKRGHWGLLPWRRAVRFAHDLATV